MADYISSLTGVAMDQALLDMAEHNSEAWAVGQRNGNPVTSDDVTYQNNAQYYAQIATSHIEPGEIGDAVRWDTDQSTVLTDANKAQARKNIAAGSTNPNLLRNWDFTNPVNSRTKTMYAPNEYAIDGWKIWGDVYARVDSGYVALAQGGSGGGIFQYLDGSVIPLLNGKTVTYSAVINDTLYSATGVFTQGAWIAANTNITGVSIVLIFPAEYPAEPISASIRLESTVSATISVKAVKVEVGGFSTLLNTPPQVYAEELTKCIYSKARADDPYANTGFGRSNRNLVDNWYFVGGGSQLGDGVFPINQRGLTSYGGGLQLDRWTTDDGLTLNSSGVHVPTGALYQNNRPSLTKSLLGKTLTASVLFADGSLEYGTATWPASIPTETTFIYYSSRTYTLTTVLFADGSSQLFRVNANDKDIAAVKLELGTVSTLANDVAPDFGEELRKCQRWLWILELPAYNYTGFNLYAADATNGVFTLVTPVPMRDDGIMPVISLSGTLNAGSGRTINSLSWSDIYGTHINVACVTSGGMTAENIYPITVGASPIRLMVSREIA